jgi:hypothetical protein
MCRVCRNFAQLRQALRAYDVSSARLSEAGREEAAYRANDMAMAIDAELHVYDEMGWRDESLLWIEC